MRATLHKSERLSGVTAISTLVSKGRWGSVEGLRYCWLSPNGTPDGKSRMAVSVPKRLFKRAVKRNLLKRRIREAYRTQKELVGGMGVDVLFTYSTKEVLDYQHIRIAVEASLRRVGKSAQRRPAPLPDGDSAKGDARLEEGRP